MTSPRRSLLTRSVITLAAGLSAALVTTGCGVSSLANGNSVASSTAMLQGKAYGGPNPIAGALITIYATGNINTGTGTVTSQGYGQGTALQTTTTDSGGNFTFAGGYTCPAGQFAYITSSGGNTGAGTNNAAELMAALGRCEDLYNGTTYVGNFIFINELSTVAAAYSLSGFATTTGQGSSAYVGIGAPSTNNATAGTTSAAAGLKHAFQNSAILFDVFHYSESARTNSPYNAGATVPSQLINSIANTLISCINSNGSASACTTLFAATGTSTSSNTFAAMLNLAKNPSLSGTGYTPTQFLNAASSQSTFYHPVLTSSPSDLSVAIQYPKGLGSGIGVQGLQYPVSLAVDANDDVFVGNYNSSAANSSNVASFLSNGTLVSFTPDNTTNIAAAGASVDAVGSLYLLNTASNGAAVYYPVSNSTGAVGSTFGTGLAITSPQASATDRANNVWFGLSSAALTEYNTGGTSQLFSLSTFGYLPNGVAVDPDQNVWVTLGVPGQPRLVGVEPNTGTVASPVYTNPGTPPNAALPGTGHGITFTSAGTPYTAYVTVTPDVTTGLIPVTRNASGVAVTSVTAGSQITSNFSVPVWDQADGSGTIWSADGSDVQSYNGTTGIQYKPCIPLSSSSNTTCKTSAYSSVNSLALDSTGAIWFVNTGNGSIGQLLGAAAPTWPLLSEGVLAKP